MFRLLALFIFLTAVACSLAQSPTPGLPQSPTPGLPEDPIRMQFPNSDVREVLNLYERLTGKKLVFDNTVQGPVNIVLSQPVSREEAIKIIEINLLLNGFSLVPADNNITKVIGLTKNPRTAGVPIFSDAQQIPDGDQIITFLFKLQNADPTELQQTL
ncbi:MAG: hypothetical protein M3O82_03665, partial [Verrucomicrobiota bacterium]|nr:hypothetical protein [Verrucomicrobiota bacterium]